MLETNQTQLSAQGRAWSLRHVLDRVLASAKMQQQQQQKQQQQKQQQQQQQERVGGRVDQEHPMDGAELGRNLPSTDHIHDKIPDDYAAMPANGPKPVFYMSTARGLSEGKVVSLHIFEPRYKVLVQEALACADRSFLWASQRPQPGVEVWLLQILSASVEDDGSADIKACATRSVRLADVTTHDASMASESDLNDESSLCWARWV